MLLTAVKKLFEHSLDNHTLLFLHIYVVHLEEGFYLNDAKMAFIPVSITLVHMSSFTKNPLHFTGLELSSAALFFVFLSFYIHFLFYFVILFTIIHHIRNPFSPPHPLLFLPPQTRSNFSFMHNRQSHP